MDLTVYILVNKQTNLSLCRVEYTNTEVVNDVLCSLMDQEKKQCVLFIGEETVRI